jgi:hypothetical protein
MIESFGTYHDKLYHVITKASPYRYSLSTLEEFSLDAKKDR